MAQPVTISELVQAWEDGTLSGDWAFFIQALGQLTGLPPDQTLQYVESLNLARGPDSPDALPSDPSLDVGQPQVTSPAGVPSQAPVPIAQARQAPFNQDLTQDFFESTGNLGSQRGNVFNRFVANQFSDFSAPQQRRIGRQLNPLSAQFALSDPDARGTFRDFLGTNPQASSRQQFDAQLKAITPFLNDSDPNQERRDLFNRNDPVSLISGIVGSGVSGDQRLFVQDAVRNQVNRFRDTNPEATTRQILREFVNRGGTLRR